MVLQIGVYVIGVEATAEHRIIALARRVAHSRLPIIEEVAHVSVVDADALVTLGYQESLVAVVAAPPEASLQNGAINREAYQLLRKVK